MVVGADNKVEVRSVNAAQAIGDKWLVTSGLKEGERVISVGTQRAKPGAQVTPQEVSAEQKSDANAQSQTQSEKTSS
jgi:membrane fusion protein (multidrug efflux system)